jgi:hypothetical protein
MWAWLSFAPCSDSLLRSTNVPVLCSELLDPTPTPEEADTKLWTESGMLRSELERKVEKITLAVRSHTARFHKRNAPRLPGLFFNVF